MATMIARCSKGGVHAAAFHPDAEDLAEFLKYADDPAMSVTLEPDQRVTLGECRRSCETKEDQSS